MMLVLELIHLQILHRMYQIKWRVCEMLTIFDNASPSDEAVSVVDVM